MKAKHILGSLLDKYEALTATDHHVVSKSYPLSNWIIYNGSIRGQIFLTRLIYGWTVKLGHASSASLQLTSVMH